MVILLEMQNLTSGICQQYIAFETIINLNLYMFYEI